LVGLEEPNITIVWLILQEYGILTWKVSDCEGLVGVNHRR